MDLPLFHFSGNLNCQMALGSGAEVILSKKFSAKKAVETFKKYKTTHLVYIGETLRFITQVPEAADDKNNKLWGLFGNGLSKNEWIKFVNRFGKDIWINEVYGATELPNVLHSYPVGCQVRDRLPDLPLHSKVPAHTLSSFLRNLN